MESILPATSLLLAATCLILFILFGIHLPSILFLLHKDASQLVGQILREALTKKVILALVIWCALVVFIRRVL